MNTFNNTVLDYKFNGDSGLFIQTTPLSSGNTNPTISSLCPFTILSIKRQYLLEDTSSKKEGMRNGTLYISPIVKDDVNEPFSLYNKNSRETFNDYENNDIFTHKGLSRYVASDKRLKLNARVIICGLFDTQLVTLNASEGNYRKLTAYLAKATQSYLFPYTHIGSRAENGFNGSSYYSLELTSYKSDNQPLSMELVRELRGMIESDLAIKNKQYIESSLPMFGGTLDFENRVNALLSKYKPEQQDSTDFPLNEKTLKEYILDVPTNQISNENIESN